jgi:putative phosphoserine phosphatase/1-acylglycerol-3-phosphate O-acyltransferase
MDSVDGRVAQVLAGPGGPGIAAFFDFDGTLLDGMSFTAFLRRPGLPRPALARGLLRIRPVLVARLLSGALRSEPGDAAIRAAFEIGFRAWAGRPAADLEAHARDVFAKDLAARLRQGSQALVRAHRHRGHTVVIVTSATRFQAGPAARALGIGHLLCSELTVADGVLTGRHDGPILRGAAKAAAVHAFATEHGIELERSHAYADTADDVPFLSTVGHPAAICPAPRLVRICAERRWPVLGPRYLAGPRHTVEEAC